MADSHADTVNRAIVATRAALVHLATAFHAQFGALRTLDRTTLERGASYLAESFAKQDIDAMSRRLNELQRCSDLLSARMRGVDVEKAVERLRDGSNDSENTTT